MPDKPRTPEHDKLSAIKDKSQAIGDFRDWLVHEKNWRIGRPHSHEESGCERETDKHGFRHWDCGLNSGQFERCYTPISELLAEFFGIDQQQLDSEKRAMLEEIRRG